MNKLGIIFTVLTALVGFAFNFDKPAYILFNGEGKEIKYEKMLKDIKDADMVFFGELHTDPISHWLEFEITKDLYAINKQNLVIGAEMFESDNQVILDEYLQEFFEDKKFEADARLWNNYKTDYKPIVEFARDSGIYFVATNIPRRYASMVYKGGFESLDQLSDEAKQFIAPLPIMYDPELPGYKNMLSHLDMGKTKTLNTKMHKVPMKQVKSDTITKDTTKQAMKTETKMHAIPANHKSMATMAHFSANLPKAQAIKDATMAHFMLENWEKGKQMIHYNGAYHSQNHEGIVWYINQKEPGLNIKTIQVVMQDEIEKLEEENQHVADYIICIPSNMTRTNR